MATIGEIRDIMKDAMQGTRQVRLVLNPFSYPDWVFENDPDLKGLEFPDLEVLAYLGGLYIEGKILVSQRRPPKRYPSERTYTIEIPDGGDIMLIANLAYALERVDVLTKAVVVLSYCPRRARRRNKRKENTP